MVMRRLGRTARYFESGPLMLFTGQQRLAVVDRLRSMPHDQVLSVPEEDLIEAIRSEFSLDPPVADFDALQVEPTERRYSYRDDFRETTVSEPGMQLDIRIPLRGDTSLLAYAPSHSRIHRFTATEGDGALWLQEDIRSFPNDPAEYGDVVRQTVDRAIEPWRQQLANLRKDIDGFNVALPAFVREQVTRRRQEALSFKAMAEAIDIPLLVRADAPSPVVLAPKRITLPVSKQPYEAEPRLDRRYYDQILDRIRHLARNMERTPEAYASLGEENLRSFVLANLNSQFGIEGMATGETFNKQGKTDILLRYRDHNLFVAECKIYTGPKAIGAALDQLLSYLTWRDSVAAIVLFVTRKDFTAAMRQAIEAAEAHHLFKRRAQAPDGEALLTFSLPDDPLREVTVAILGFALPKRSSAGG